MALVNKVGLEAEYLLHNTKGEIIVPPATWDRDGFPLLGEIRGEAGKTAAEAVANFDIKRLELISKLHKGHSICFVAVAQCPLTLYRKVNKEINYAEKAATIGKIKNIHSLNIEDYSDQIISKGKIQGVRISCGLHVHFSSEEVKELKQSGDTYAPVRLPISVGKVTKVEDVALAGTILNPEILLYRRTELEEKTVLKCTADQLNKPTITHIVNEMDKAFFERFAPPKAERTKFRQPGFFELKPYGFEYRSLPMTPEVGQNLFEIATFAFSLLDNLRKFD